MVVDLVGTLGTPPPMGLSRDSVTVGLTEVFFEHIRDVIRDMP